MTIIEKKEKLHEFINTADDKKVEAIYTLVEDDIEDVYDHWEDEEFVAEIKSRIEDFESGTDKGLSWEEVKTRARKEFKAGQ